MEFGGGNGVCDKGQGCSLESQMKCGNAVHSSNITAYANEKIHKHIATWISKRKTVVQ